MPPVQRMPDCSGNYILRFYNSNTTELNIQGHDFHVPYFEAGNKSLKSEQSIHCRAYARMGLMGNPGDALGGNAIGVVIRDLYAEARLTPSDSLKLQEPAIEHPDWSDIDAMRDYVIRRGYSGGRRLMMALLFQLHSYLQKINISCDYPTFCLTWHSIIPNRVGLAGSSALITAALRTIMQYWKLEIPLIDQVQMVLKTETDSLGIPAGPLDRVAQVYEGLTYFEPDNKGFVQVERLPLEALPKLFVAIDESSGEGTEVFHSNLRAKFLSGDPEVIAGVKELSQLARQARDLIVAGKGNEIGPLMDQNFDVRNRLIQLNPRHIRMIESARKVGAHAKFAGSGGAIVGTCEEVNMNAVLEHLQQNGYRAFSPVFKEHDSQ